MLNILITGTGGFIGRNLVAHFSLHHNVEAPLRCELDLLDAAAVGEYLKHRHFDVVIHAASERSNRRLSNAPDLLDHNCRMFFNLASHAVHFGRMLFLSSGAVYDRAHWRPLMPESYFGTHIPSDAYGFSKYICAKSIAEGGNIFELRLFGVFGPHEDWRVRFLSNACCRAVWDTAVTIRRNVVFDYLDVADLGWLLDAFLNREFHRRRYNICAGHTFDLRTLAEKVVRASGKALEIKIHEPGLGMEYSGDNTRLLQEVPDFQFHDMDDSISRLYRWYEGQKSLIDPSLLHFDG